jgi:hypothetical protein
MRNPARTTSAVFVSICLFLPTAAAHTYSLRQAASAERAPLMTTQTARGTFDVKLSPQGSDDKAEGSALGSLSLDKRFHGNLEGSSKGTMLTALTDVKGSAGYVAIERVTGTLHGRSGSFVLQHTGVMTRGAQQLTVAVVPDSGTGQLVGIAGNMDIIIADGKHSYNFQYTLVKAP